MTDIRSLIENIAQALGPEASAEQVERVARLFLAPARNGSAQPIQRSSRTPIGVHLASTSIGISLLDCSSRLPSTVAARAYDKIRRIAGLHRKVIREISSSLGVSVQTSGITVTPCAVLLDSGTPSDFVALATSLEQAAIDVNADFVSGYSAVAHRGLSRGAASLIDSLPEMIRTTNRLTASISCACSTAGVNHTAVSHLAEAIATIRDAAPALTSRNERIFATYDSGGYDVNLDSSFHGIGEAELTVNVQLADASKIHSSLSKSAEIATTVAIAMAESLSERSGKVFVVGRVLPPLSKGAADQDPAAASESTLASRDLSPEKIANLIAEDLERAISAGSPHRLVCL